MEWNGNDTYSLQRNSNDKSYRCMAKVGFKIHLDSRSPSPRQIHQDVPDTILSVHVLLDRWDDRSTLDHKNVRLWYQFQNRNDEKKRERNVGVYFYGGAIM